MEDDFEIPLESRRIRKVTNISDKELTVTIEFFGDQEFAVPRAPGYIHGNRSGVGQYISASFVKQKMAEGLLPNKEGLPAIKVDVQELKEIIWKLVRNLTTPYGEELLLELLDRIRTLKAAESNNHWEYERQKGDLDWNQEYREGKYPWDEETGSL